jgi:hypothetical protein
MAPGHACNRDRLAFVGEWFKGSCLELPIAPLFAHEIASRDAQYYSFVLTATSHLHLTDIGEQAPCRSLTPLSANSFMPCITRDAL